MFSDLLARLFVAAFFVAYVVVMIFLIRWAIRTWPGSRRRRSQAKSAAHTSVSEAKLAIDDADCEEGSPGD